MTVVELLDKLDVVANDNREKNNLDYVIVVDAFGKLYGQIINVVIRKETKEVILEVE